MMDFFYSYFSIKQTITTSTTTATTTTTTAATTTSTTATTTEALPGVWGNRGIRPFIYGEQGNKSLKLKGTGEQTKTILENRENRKLKF